MHRNQYFKLHWQKAVNAIGRNIPITFFIFISNFSYRFYYNYSLIKSKSQSQLPLSSKKSSDNDVDDADGTSDTLDKAVSLESVTRKNIAESKNQNRYSYTEVRNDFYLNMWLV